jgi:membrane-associated PAP2 superfamily phosphatase
MTHQERHELLRIMEKSWITSKKFIAFFVMELLLTVIIILTLKTQTIFDWALASFMIGVIFVMGFIAVAFNLSQAQLDQYVRGAALLGNISGGLINKTIIPTEEDKSKI